MADEKKTTAETAVAAPATAPVAPAAPPAKTQLEILQERADTLGIVYTSETSVDDLKAKVSAKLNGDEEPKEKAASKDESEIEKANRERQEAFLEATKLIRCRITNMNPAKADLACETFWVSNGIVGVVSRTIPYGEQADGWHVEQMLLNMLLEKKFQQIRTIKGPNGQMIPQTKWVKEFAIEILPPLTEKELKILANKQAAAEGNAE